MRPRCYEALKKGTFCFSRVREILKSPEAVWASFQHVGSNVPLSAVAMQLTIATDLGQPILELLVRQTLRLLDGFRRNSQDVGGCLVNLKGWSNQSQMRFCNFRWVRVIA